MKSIADEQDQVGDPEPGTLTLADLRRKAGKTTRQTAVALGLTQPRITQIEQEGTKDVEQMERLAAFYCVEFDDVYKAARRARSRLDIK